MFNWFKKTKWAHVKVLTLSARHNHVDGTVYVHLYESDNGNRKIELVSTFGEGLKPQLSRYVRST